MAGDGRSDHDWPLRVQRLARSGRRCRALGSAKDRKPRVAPSITERALLDPALHGIELLTAQGSWYCGIKPTAGIVPGGLAMSGEIAASISMR